MDLLAPLPEPRQMRDAHVVRDPYPPVRARRARRAGAQDGGEAAFRAAMAEPLGELPPIYRQMPIYYITNRSVGRRSRRDRALAALQHR